MTLQQSRPEPRNLNSFPVHQQACQAVTMFFDNLDPNDMIGPRADGGNGLGKTMSHATWIASINHLPTRTNFCDGVLSKTGQTRLTSHHDAPPSCLGNVLRKSINEMKIFSLPALKSLTIRWGNIRRPSERCDGLFARSTRRN